MLDARIQRKWMMWFRISLNNRRSLTDMPLHSKITVSVSLLLEYVNYNLSDSQWSAFLLCLILCSYYFDILNWFFFYILNWFVRLVKRKNTLKNHIRVNGFISGTSLVDFFCWENAQFCSPKSKHFLTQSITFQCSFSFAFLSLNLSFSLSLALSLFISLPINHFPVISLWAVLEFIFESVHVKKCRINS